MPAESGLRLPGSSTAAAPTNASKGTARRLIEEIGSVEASHEQPEHELLSSDASLTLRCRLPRVRAASELDLQVGERTLSLVAEGIYQLRLDLPAAVCCDEIKSRFTKKGHVLTVVMPLSK